MAGERFHPERIYNYFSVHLKLAIQPDFILDISDQWEQKKAAIECYHSQFIAGRSTESPTFIDQLEAQAMYFGSIIGTRYGEPFACKEPIGMTSMRDFV